MLHKQREDHIFWTPRWSYFLKIWVVSCGLLRFSMIFHLKMFPEHRPLHLFGYNTSWRIASIRFSETLGGNSKKSPFSCDDWSALLAFPTTNGQPTATKWKTRFFNVFYSLFCKSLAWHGLEIIGRSSNGSSHLKAQGFHQVLPNFSRSSATWTPTVQCVNGPLRREHPESFP